MIDDRSCYDLPNIVSGKRRDEFRYRAMKIMILCDKIRTAPTPGDELNSGSLAFFHPLSGLCFLVKYLNQGDDKKGERVAWGLVISSKREPA